MSHCTVTSQAKKALGNWAKAAALERRQNLRKGIEKESISYKLARKLVLR